MAAKLDVASQLGTTSVFHALNTIENGKGSESPTVQQDPFLVAFDEPGDRENPKNWPTAKKWAVTGVLSATGLNRIMVSTIMAPALSNVASDLHMNNVESVMAMSVYLLATAFGPLAIGPLSEVYGRKPVLHATNIWFLIWNIVCGFANSKGMLIAARFLAGFGASAIYALAGGVLGDIWRPEQRGRSLGLYAVIPMLGAAVGPIVGGFITEAISWRWVFWSTSILQAIMVVLSFFLFAETYDVVILQQRAKHLRRTTGNYRYLTRTDKLYGGRSPFWVLRRSLTRPMRLLMFHPIIQVQACLSGFNYGILYLVLSTLSDLWTSRYDQSISISGLHYVSTCIGEVLAALLGGPLMDLIFRKLKDRENGNIPPEFRIPIMFPSALLVPIGLLVYGWAAEKHLFWLVVDIGAAILCFGMNVSGQALLAYVIDSYSDHASSASAASQFLRSLTAFGFPLFAPAMYASMGYGWGNTLLAFLALAIGIPAPVLIWLYGAKLREKAQSSY